MIRDAAAPGLPNIDAAITLQTPATTTTVSPNLALKQVAPVGARDTFQAQDVTALIQQGGSGVYTVSNVPGQVAVDGTSIIGNSWNIIVVYENPSLPIRYFNVNTGLSAVSSAAPSAFDFTGFTTPPTGPVKAYFLLSQEYGDLADAATISVGATQPSATQIGNASNPWNGVAPYAYINNMLPSNILIADTNNPNIGLLDTSGTFGGNNKNPFNNTAPAFARVNADIAGFDISNKVTNGQTSLSTRVTFLGAGSSNVNSQSVQVDVNAPNLIPLVKRVNTTAAKVGDVLTYTLTTTNTGTIAADNVVLTDDGVSVVTFEREGFQAMLADVKASKISRVLVKDMSRFGRNYLEVGMFTDVLFPSFGVHFVAVNDGVDSKRGDNEFTAICNIFKEISC